MKRNRFLYTIHIHIRRVSNGNDIKPTVKLEEIMNKSPGTQATIYLRGNAPSGLGWGDTIYA
jgi:hypothetical protein